MAKETRLELLSMTFIGLQEWPCGRLQFSHIPERAKNLLRRVHVPQNSVHRTVHSLISTFHFLGDRFPRLQVSVLVPNLSYFLMLIFSPRDGTRSFFPPFFLSVSPPPLFLFCNILNRVNSNDIFIILRCNLNLQSQI